MQKFREYLHSFSLRAHLAALLFVVASIGVLATTNTGWWPWSASAETREERVEILRQGIYKDVPQEMKQKYIENGGTITALGGGQYHYEPPENLFSVGTAGKCSPVFGQFELIHSDCPLNVNLRNIYQKSISLAFLAVFLVIVYAGYQYITSLGNPEKVKSAAELVTGAITGLALLLLIPLIMQELNLNQSASSLSPAVTPPTIEPGGTSPSSGGQQPAATTPSPGQPDNSTAAQ